MKIMFQIKKAILMLALAVALTAPAAAPAQPAEKQPPLEAAYFAQITDLVTRKLEEDLPKEKWPAERIRIMVLVQIQADGTISRSELAIKSEHEYMNQALMAALEKAQPLPAPPKEFQIESGLRLIGLAFSLDKNSPPAPAPEAADAAE